MQFRATRHVVLRSKLDPKRSIRRKRTEVILNRASIFKMALYHGGETASFVVCDCRSTKNYSRIPRMMQCLTLNANVQYDGPSLEITAQKLSA
ncbi:unnamed protein product [Sphagnum tenellum]